MYRFRSSLPTVIALGCSWTLLSVLPHAAAQLAPKEFFADMGLVDREYDLTALLPSKPDRGDIDDLHDIIKSTLEQDSWLNNGGYGQLEFKGKKVLVVTTPEIQTEMKQFLELLAKSIDAERRRAKKE